nr:MAG TPA: hypothetical protein [Bacteriophage sp.]
MQQGKWLLLFWNQYSQQFLTQLPPAQSTRRCICGTRS